MQFHAPEFFMLITQKWDFLCKKNPRKSNAILKK